MCPDYSTLPAKPENYKYTNRKIYTFRQRFCMLFDECGKTTTALAKDLHVSNQTISAWRTGVRSPKQPMIITLAKYFGVSFEWIMGFDVPKDTTWIDYKEDVEEPPAPQTPEARILAKGIDKMPKAQREAIINMMQGLYPGLFEKGTEEDDA